MFKRLKIYGYVHKFLNVVEEWHIKFLGKHLQHIPQTKQTVENFTNTTAYYTASFVTILTFIFVSYPIDEFYQSNSVKLNRKRSKKHMELQNTDKELERQPHRTSMLL